LIQKR